ncbi:hypothetical protein D0T84_16785 [Dysgonomonas sp. 521]|uniref:hypothetical protein n=1 Tax=Dysgonomonas sp. 521 TaxID=2302932 RepID=UPI0013D8B034|nr:hypothetical protein [Dysgonomonas sp. 521]NDV96558.1 hypothetical protein [Dysgonomonas sp. 521]
MLHIVPEKHRRPLFMAIAKGESEQVKSIIEKNNINPNSFSDEKYDRLILMDVLTSFGYKDKPQERLDLMRFLLDKGADVNMNCRSGYNTMHIAIRQVSQMAELDLMLNYNPDVNETDSIGANLLYWSIQGFPWRESEEIRQQWLHIMERILMLGGDLDQANHYGATPRKWLEHKTEEVKELVEKCEALHPVYTPVKSKQPEFPTNLKYPDVAKKIWKEMVPLRGQAPTVQGELLRIVEKLRDEACRNGNINYSKDHKLMAKFVKDTLIDSDTFEKGEKKQIKEYIKLLSVANRPYIEDDAYDYLTDRICEFYNKHPEPIPHSPNPNIFH